MTRSFHAVFFALNLLSFSIMASAQDSIYRGVDAKGQTVYSNSAKGLGGARKIQLPEPVLTGAESPKMEQAPAPAIVAPRSATPGAALSGELSRFEQAQVRLRDAQNIYDAGEEPTPGERLGTAGGGSRLAPGYYERREREAKVLAEARTFAVEAGAR